MGRARVLIADDNYRMLEQVASRLSTRFDVVACVTNGRDAVVSALRDLPDVAVLDISMSTMNGLRAAEQMRKSGCRVAIVFLTVHDDQQFLHAARAAGALGYVLKSRIASDLEPAIDAAVNGRTFVSEPLLAEAVEPPAM